MVRESVVNTDQTVQTTLVTEPVEESEGTENKIKNETVVLTEGKKKGGTWKKVTIGGLTGIALGIAGAYGKEVMGEWANEEVIEEPDNGNTLPPTTEDEIAEQSGKQDLQQIYHLKFPPQDQHLQYNVAAEHHGNAGTQLDPQDPADHIGQRIHRGNAQIAVDGYGNTEGQQQKAQAVDTDADDKLDGGTLFHGALFFL